MGGIWRLPETLIALVFISMLFQLVSVQTPSPPVALSKRVSILTHGLTYPNSQKQSGPSMVSRANRFIRPLILSNKNLYSLHSVLGETNLIFCLWYFTNSSHPFLIRDVTAKHFSFTSGAHFSSSLAGFCVTK